MRRIGRGFGRTAVGIALAVAGLLVGVAAVRIGGLHGLPDLGPLTPDPAAEAPVSARENASWYYRRAAECLGEGEPATMKGGYVSWAEVDDAQLRWLENHRAALTIWREGTGLDRARAGDDRTIAPGPITRRAYALGRLANLEALRLDRDGDRVGAWGWLAANLRFARHLGQGSSMVDRLLAVGIFEATARQAGRWADGPASDPASLRRALADVVALDEARAPESAWVREEYASAVRTLADVDARDVALLLEWYAPTDVTPRIRAEVRLASTLSRAAGEPERSRRVVRLVLGNWLTACNLPAAERSARAVQFGDLTLFRPGPGDPSPLPLEDVAAWFASTRFARAFLANLSAVDRSLGRDETNRAALVVHLARRLHEVERGTPPEADRALVGPSLKSLTVGPPASEGDR